MPYRPGYSIVLPRLQNRPGCPGGVPLDLERTGEWAGLRCPARRFGAGAARRFWADGPEQLWMPKTALDRKQLAPQKAS